MNVLEKILEEIKDNAKLGNMHRKSEADNSRQRM